MSRLCACLLLGCFISQHLLFVWFFLFDICLCCCYFLWDGSAKIIVRFATLRQILQIKHALLSYYHCETDSADKVCSVIVLLLRDTICRCYCTATVRRIVQIKHALLLYCHCETDSVDKECSVIDSADKACSVIDSADKACSVIAYYHSVTDSADKACSVIDSADKA